MGTNQHTLLEASDLHKSFDNPVSITILRGISLKISTGESVAIMGRSGEGKSTLLHILGTLEPPSKGFLSIAGQEVGRYNCNLIRNQHIGFVFQSFHLLEDYTVLDNVLMPARIARQPVSKGSQAYQRAAAALEKVGLAHRVHFNTKLLSGGEKQRVGIARAFANVPSLVLADEPSGNLDRQNSLAIQQLLLNAAHEDGMGVIIVTHDAELASRCDRRYQLRDGQLVQV